MATMAMLLLGLMPLLLVLRVSANHYRGHTFDPLSLRIMVTSSSATFATQAAQQYLLQRDGEVVVQTSLGAPPTVPGITRAENAFLALAAGAADAAFIPRIITPADAITAPDLLAFPMWATGFAPVYNLPDATGKLILSQQVLAKIYMGTITW